MDSPTQTDRGLCTTCSTCINVCSEAARSFEGPEYNSQMRDAMINNFERKEAEFFL
jgi:ferredoxin